MGKYEYILHPRFNELFHFLIEDDYGTWPLGVKRYQENDNPDLTLLTVSLPFCSGDIASKAVKTLKDILIWEEVGNDRQELARVIEDYEKMESVIRKWFNA